MIIRYILYFIFGAGLIACSSVHNIFIESNTYIISDHLEQNNQADSLILPYRLSSEKEMREVISKSKNKLQFSIYSMSYLYQVLKSTAFLTKSLKTDG